MGLMTGPIRLSQVRSALGGASSRLLDRPRRAAVALVLGPATRGLAVLLVRRSEREGDPWSGHMALPGGHAHELDADLLHTARRETLEEVGLELSRAELLGQLDDVSPMRSSEIMVRPFAFWAEAPQTLSLSNELSEAIWVPLDELVTGTLRESREVEVRGTKLVVPAFVIEERVVWGMTFHVLDGFVSRLRRQG
jgi:8-oxo-dGTP pyrophosphatase MutT (NUDIX family)